MICRHVYFFRISTAHSLNFHLEARDVTAEKSHLQQFSKFGEKQLDITSNENKTVNDIQSIKPIIPK